MTRLSFTLATGVAVAALCVTSGPGSLSSYTQLASSAQAQAQGQGSKKSHPHHHINAHALLGENLHHDGKHAIGKIGSHTVSAEVKGGKVVNMDAGGLPMTKVKSKSKMANAETGFIRAAYNGVQLAQYDSSEYYGYCTDDGYETTCYWYEASDVDPNSGDWVEYTTYDSTY